MKKILTKLICTALVLCMACSSLIACSSSSWSGSVTLKNAGALKEVGGFIAETENYVYFINGKAESTDDNTLGTPLKGALCVASKADLSKVEVVVPKLFVASDSGAGLFLDGNYVYYGSPSTEKNSEGVIANDQLTFAKTKLDGSGETQEFFTISGISTEYRIVKGDKGVCIYYYDAENSAIMCYNTKDAKAYEVIKTDAKQKDYSLDKYKFLDADGSNGIIALLTVTIYQKDYDEEAAKNPTYSRLTENYNEIYAIKAGESKITKIASGKNEADPTNNLKFEIKLVNDDYLFYSQTSATNVTTTKAVALSEISSLDKAVEIKNADYVADTNVIAGLDEVYVLGETKLYKTTLTAKDNAIKLPIALKEKISSLLYKNGDYLYMYNSSNQLCRMNVNSDSQDFGKQVRISQDTVMVTWFDPEIKTIGEKDYIFYCDNSAQGQSYIKYTDLSGEVKVQESEDETAEDVLYIDGEAKLLGTMTVKDSALIITTKINKIKDTLPEGGLTGTDEDAEFKAQLKAVKDEYKAIANSEVKNAVDQTAVALLDQYDKALDIVDLYKKLDGIQDCHSQTEADAEFKNIYTQNKTAFETFKNGEDRDVIDALISNNVKSLYTMAYKFFEN